MSGSAVVGVPATAMRTNKQHLRNALKGVVDSLMIVSEPFAVAYGLNALLHTMIIDIGAGTTDFCVMKGRYPTDDDQRSLTAAGDSIDTQLMKLIGARYPTASFTVFMVREWKEKSSFVGEAPESVIVTVPVNGVPTRIDITQEMKTACESIVPPIVETMLDLLLHVVDSLLDSQRGADRRGVRQDRQIGRASLLEGALLRIEVDVLSGDVRGLGGEVEALPEDLRVVQHRPEAGLGDLQRDAPMG